MSWQDIVISVCQICFIFALLPSLRSHHKPAAITSIMNSILIFIITGCLLSLQLWVSGVTAGMVAVCWVILAVQKLKLDRAEKAAKAS